MNNIRKRAALCFVNVAAAFMLTIALPGCGMLPFQENDSQEMVKEAATVRQPGIYDSEDAAVVVKKDIEAGTVQFQNIATSRRYTLHYDGTTALYDRNNQAMSMEQLREGSVVTVRFYKADKSLTYVRETPDCISYSGVQNYSMNLKDGTITIGSELFNISGHVIVVSDGRETDMMEVNQVDVISVWGYKNMIYGINVEKGHGYLRLQNEDYFVATVCPPSATKILGNVISTPAPSIALRRPYAFTCPWPIPPLKLFMLNDIIGEEPSRSIIYFLYCLIPVMYWSIGVAV